MKLLAGHVVDGQEGAQRHHTAHWRPGGHRVAYIDSTPLPRESRTEPGQQRRDTGSSRAGRSADDTPETFVCLSVEVQSAERAVTFWRNHKVITGIVVRFARHVRKDDKIV